MMEVRCETSLRAEDGVLGSGGRLAKRYYRPELDALRFFAFLTVFLHHSLGYAATNPARIGWLYQLGMSGAFGLPLFFLLSAFLITELLLREREVTGQVHLAAFYLRRVLRIWPLYFAVFYGVVILNRFVPGMGTANPHVWLAYTCFVSNWYITLRGWHAGTLDPLWSISVEEQFYLVIPILACLGGRRALLWASLLLLLVSGVTVFCYGHFRSPGDHGEWTNSLVHLQFFSAGTLLALKLRGRLPDWSLPARAGTWALALVCWLAANMTFHVRSWDPQPTAWGSVAGWGLVLAGTSLFFLGALGLSVRYVPSWLAYCGRISYGLYLFHSPVLFVIFIKGSALFHLAAQHGRGLQHGLRVLALLVALLVSLLLAHLSYHYFESLFLRLKRRYTLVASRDSF